LSSWKDKKYHEIVKNQAYILVAESDAVVLRIPRIGEKNNKIMGICFWSLILSRGILE